MFALMAAAGRDFPIRRDWAAGRGAGAVELHGSALLRQGEAARHELAHCQPAVLLSFLSYCALRFWLRRTAADTRSLPVGLRGECAAMGLSVAEYQRALNRITAMAVAVAAVGFQGGIMLYYLRRRQSVGQALAVEG